LTIAAARLTEPVSASASMKAFWRSLRVTSLASSLDSLIRQREAGIFLFVSYNRASHRAEACRLPQEMASRGRRVAKRARSTAEGHKGRSLCDQQSEDRKLPRSYSRPHLEIRHPYRYNIRMNTELKVRKIGNSAGVVLPKELLARLRIGPGDTLYATESPDGVRLTAADPDFEAKMAVAETIMREDRDILRVLAK